MFNYLPKITFLMGFCLAWVNKTNLVRLKTSGKKKKKLNGHISGFITADTEFPKLLLIISPNVILSLTFL